MEKESAKVIGIKRRLGKLQSSELREIRRYLDAREKEVRKREWEAKVTAAWDEIKGLGLEQGDLLFNNQSGVTLGATWQRGDCGVVVQTRPRKRVIWIATEFTWVAVTPGLWVRDRIGTELPPAFATESDIKLAGIGGRVLSEAFGRKEE